MQPLCAGMGARLRSLCQLGSAVLGRAQGREQVPGLVLGVLAGCGTDLGSGVSAAAFGSLL